MTTTLEKANEQLVDGYSPGIVIFEDESTPPTLYLHTRVLNSGWLHTVAFNGTTVEYAPDTVLCVERAEIISKLESDDGERRFDPEWFKDKLSGNVEVV